MKNVTMILVALFAYVSSTTAQEVMFGGKAGLNVANVTTDEESTTANLGGLDDSNTLVSFHAGITGDIKASEMFGFGAELLYSRQGAKYENDIVDGTVNLDYLAIPILLKFYAGENFNIYSGVQPSFLLNGKADGDLFGISGEIDLKDEDFVKDNDLSIPVGIGYRTSNGIALDARYNIGTTAIYENSDNDADDVGKNRVFQVGIGFNF